MIKVYSKKDCAACTQAKNLLEKAGLPFQYKVLDVDYDIDELMTVAERHGIVPRSFPLIEVDETTLIATSSVEKFIKEMQA